MADELTVGDAIPQNSEPIEIHVSELSLLFNAMDPSPLPVKDLDPKAEEFIVSWARSLHRDAQLAIQVDVDRPGVSDHMTLARDGIHEFFRQRSLSASRRPESALSTGSDEPLDWPRLPRGSRHRRRPGRPSAGRESG